MARRAWNKRTLDDLTWFWALVDKSGDCWLWQGTVEVQGYGVARVSGKFFKAHVLAYELTNGPKPPGLTLDHLCRVKRCVRPSHLEAVTHRVNVLRGVGPTAVNAIKDECDHGHRFDEANTYWRKNAQGRDCRACRRARCAAYYARKRAAA